MIGNSIAMVASGPIPGNTPIRVPTSAPSRHSMRLVGLGGDAETEREIGQEIHHGGQSLGQSDSGRLSA